MTFDWCEMGRRSAGWLRALGLALAVSVLGGLLPAPARAQPASDWLQREDVRAFMRALVERHGFSEGELSSILSRARPSESAIRFMAPPPAGTRRSWSQYRGRFIDQVRIREGLRFWRENRTTLRRAAEQFGVPEDIIVSIIGIETLYGRQAGDFRVIDVLATLAFDYPRRAEYFREELEQYLLLARETGFDPLSWRGSFAGAVGLPQFMPGSIRRHAVDFDGDGRIDLRASPADAIGSVANFLVNHGWRKGAATHYPAALEDESRARPAVEAGIPPRLLMSELASLGVSSPQSIPPDEPVSLIDLPDGDQPTQYVLGAQNFYVITRYNRSYFYAMVVIDFARELRTALAAAPSRTIATTR